MKDELIKRRVFDFIQRRRRQKDSIFGYKDGFAPILVRETDLEVFGEIDFDQLGLVLIDIEKEYYDNFRVTNTLGLEKGRELNLLELEVYNHLEPHKRPTHEEVRYIEVQCKMDIRAVSNSKNLIDKKVTFYLTNSGKLYTVRGNGDKTSYIFREGIRLKVLEHFIENKTLVPSEFANGAGKKQEDYIRKEIIRLRKFISEKFEGIDSKDFIPDAIPGDGYRLGEGVKIVRSNN